MAILLLPDNTGSATQNALLSVTQCKTRMSLLVALVATSSKNSSVGRGARARLAINAPGFESRCFPTFFFFTVRSSFTSRSLLTCVTRGLCFRTCIWARTDNHVVVLPDCRHSPIGAATRWVRRENFYSAAFKSVPKMRKLIDLRRDFELTTCSG